LEIVTLLGGGKKSKGSAAWATTPNVVTSDEIGLVARAAAAELDVEAMFNLTDLSASAAPQASAAFLSAAAAAPLAPPPVESKPGLRIPDGHAAEVLVIFRAAKRERGGRSAPSGMAHFAGVRMKAAVGAEVAPVVLGCVPATSDFVSVVVVVVLSFSPSRCGLHSAAPNVGTCIVDNVLL
jgi:hypothetical protein